jgi:hypothetical protein
MHLLETIFRKQHYYEINSSRHVQAGNLCKYSQSATTTTSHGYTSPVAHQTLKTSRNTFLRGVSNCSSQSAALSIIRSISRYLFDLSVVSSTFHVIAITKWCTKASPHHYTTVSMTYARVVSVRFYLMSFKYCSLEIFAYITSLNNHHHPRLQCIFTVRDHHLR